ncbi:actin family [Ephemerocybe angulata]|uniref:Actin family n=1 Tax=Ephemerocybe angulata TaxID=980116 RepID=A0A8H6HVA4_9AGAR|nr:actin family [Tulosesus angulatus]
MSLRDANVVIIETSRTHIRAVLGLHELLKTPSVEFHARVGLRKSGEGNNGEASSSSKPTAQVNDYLVGLQLDEALAGPDAQDIEVSWPFLTGEVTNWVQAEALWKHVLFTHLQRKRTVNESPVLITLPSPTPSRTLYERTCQIFFERFNVPAFAILDRPLAQLYAANSLSGVVVDIGEDLTEITPINEGVLVHSAKLQTRVGTRMCRHYLAHLLKGNSSVMQTLFPGGAADQAQVHSTLLRLADYLVYAGLIKPPSSGEAAPPPEDEGVTDIAAVVVAGREKAVIESGMKKKLNAKASAAEQARAREIEALDLATVEFEGREITVGKERHRFCEPIFDPAVVDKLGLERFGSGAGEWVGRGEEGLPPLKAEGRKVEALQDAVGRAVGQADTDMRQYLWQGLFVTGDVTRFVKGIGVSLQSRLSPFIASSGLDTDIQPRTIRVLNVPEYYAEYRETGNGYSAFLGSSIVAKIIFNDHNAKNYLSKADYTAKGPHGIIEMSPSLL